MKNSRPNILLIMADQLSAQWLGAYGHPVVQTPHLNALAERGVLFEAAYANCPICAPSRAGMCTGRHVGEIGAYDNGTDFASSIPTFMHHLRRADYEVVLSGKMHFLGPDQLHGFERRLTPEIYPSSFVWTPDWTRGAYHNPGTAVDQLRDSGLCDWNMQLDYDEEVQFRALEELRDQARRRHEGRPFFLCASFTHPHEPFITTRQWWDLYAHDRIDPPAAPALPMDRMHPYDRWLQIHHMIDVYPPREEDVRNARHAYYGMISYFDSKVGELIGELERLGLAENTLVFVTSDHGEMLGEHGMWFKRTYFEPSSRVPLLCAGTDRVPSGRRVGRTVSLVDLFPTFLEIAELDDWQDAESSVDGTSLGGLLAGTEAAWKDYALIEYYSEGVCQPMRAAVSDRLKYVYVHRESPQLFDLAEDPHELHNCIDDPSYAQRLERLKRLVHDGWNADDMLARVLEKQRNRRLINEAMAHGRAGSWDIEPHFDAGRQYVRTEDAQITNVRRRYPRIDPGR